MNNEATNETNLKKQTAIVIDTHNSAVVNRICRTELKTGTYRFTPIVNGQQKLDIDDENMWTLMKEKLVENKIAHHTFGNKETSQPCYIVKNVSHDYTVEEIKEELANEGFEPISVSHFSTNKQIRENKRSTMIKIVLRPGTDTKKFESVKYMFNTRVFIEKMKTSGVVQCKNCQLIGHTSRFCFHQYRCIKCTENHLPGKGQCKLDNGNNTLAPKCVNCQGDHIASSYNCPYIKKHMTKNDKTHKKIENSQNMNWKPNVKPGISFADVANMNTKQTKPNKQNKTAIMKEFMSQMQKLMTLLMNEND